MSVTAGGPGLVATGVDKSGEDFDRDGAVWASEDGYTWTRVRDEAVFGGPEIQQIYSVISWGRILIAVGDGAVWLSPLQGYPFPPLSSVTVPGTTYPHGPAASEEVPGWFPR